MRDNERGGGAGLRQIKVEDGARNRWANSRNGWQQGVSGLLALPLQLVLDQWDDPHRMEECNCTHTKKVRGVCRMDEFRGISLVPVAYKAMCGIIQERLTQVVGERNLVAEEQGGFKRGRGCRDQC